MYHEAVAKFCGFILVFTLILFFAGCATTSGSGGSGSGGSTGSGGSGSGGGSGNPASSAPRFLYFVTDAHPSSATIDQNGAPGAVQEYPKPDGSERAVGVVAANPAGTFLYVTEFQNSGSGLYYVAMFSIDQNTGALTHTTSIQIPNSGGIKVDPTGSVLVVAGSSVSVPNAGNPQVTLYKISGDGGLTAAGAPISVFGQQVLDLLFDASRQNLYVLSNQADPATPGSSLQSLRVDATTGSATPVQSIPLSIDATELAVAGSKFVYLSGVGSFQNDIAGWSIQPDGSLAPITGTPFGSGFNAYGLAASPNGSMIYASDFANQNVAWYSVSSTGALTLVGTTAANTLVPAVAPQMMIDRSGKYLHSTSCDPKAPPPGCAVDFWGGTIASDGSVTPMNGAPFSDFAQPVRYCILSVIPQSV